MLLLCDTLLRYGLQCLWGSLRLLRVWLQCYGHAEEQVVSMELDRREKEALEAEARLQSIGAIRAMKGHT